MEGWNFNFILQFIRKPKRSQFEFINKDVTSTAMKTSCGKTDENSSLFQADIYQCAFWNFSYWELNRTYLHFILLVLTWIPLGTSYQCLVHFKSEDFFLNYTITIPSLFEKLIMFLCHTECRNTAAFLVIFWIERQFEYLLRLQNVTVWKLLLL